MNTKGLTRTEPSGSETDILTHNVVNGIQEKKGHDITIIDLRKLNSAIADIFIICHGDSENQVKAIAESVIDEVKKHLGESPMYQEGFTNSEWILIDYINVVVHVFKKEQREYYGIEQFYADADIKKIA